MIKLFKKSKQAVNATVEKLENQQLKQVVGGDGGDTVTGPTETTVVRSRSNIRTQ